MNKCVKFFNKLYNKYEYYLLNLEIYFRILVLKDILIFKY